jgi:hypothetical protein
MSARKSPSFSKPSPSKLQSPQGKIPASGSEGRKSEAQAEEGRFQPAADLRIAPMVAAEGCAFQGTEWGAGRKRC